MIVVIARTYADFRYWCRSMEMSYRQPNIRFISRPDRLRDFDWPNVQLVLLSGWYLNKKHRLIDVIRYAKVMGADVFELEV